jgi:CubicO group peptidase (beta-lactamase class C family)
LESATKRDLSEYAKEKIWDKIGTESDIYWNLDKENGDEKAFCCLYASAKDYARLGMVLLHKGNYNGQQIIPTDYYLDMVSPEPLTTEENIPNYRYGLQTWTYMDDEVQVNYLRGVKGQYIITVPEEDLLIVRLGSYKEPNFELDETQLSDPLYFETNKFKVGHSTSFLEVLKLARSISDKTKVK